MAREDGKESERGGVGKRSRWRRRGSEKVTPTALQPAPERFGEAGRLQTLWAAFAGYPCKNWWGALTNLVWSVSPSRLREASDHLWDALHRFMGLNTTGPRPISA